MKRPKNPTKVIKGIGILGGNGECSCLYIEKDTIEIVDGNRKKNLKRSQQHSLDLIDLFPTPYKSSQEYDRGDRFRFRIEVEIEVIK